METITSAAEQPAAVLFNTLMQREIARRHTESGASEQSGAAELLAAHGVGPDAVLPAAAPADANLLTEADWQGVAASPTPFTELWSKSNRRALEDRIHTRYASYDPLTGQEVTYPTSPVEKYTAMEAEARLRAQPTLHSTSVDTLTKARAHGLFLSNRAVHDLKGGYEGLLTDIGNTWEEDREVGLDGYVFADFARPATRRLEQQADVVVVFKPEAMQTPGTIITDHDYVDSLMHNETTNPIIYMSSAYTAEDFYDTADMQAETKRSASGHTENGVFIHNRLNISETYAGRDGNFDESGEPHFSTWEVKIPEVAYDAVDRLIFRTDQAKDAYLAANPDNTTPFIVEPSIKAAMARREDIFGTNARTKALLDQEITKDYAGRKTIIDTADPDTLTVKYQLIHPQDSLQLDPAWLGQEQYATPDEIVSREKKTQQTAKAVMDLFAEESDIETFASDEPVSVARIVQVGGTAVIENVTHY